MTRCRSASPRGRIGEVDHADAAFRERLGSGCVDLAGPAARQQPGLPQHDIRFQGLLGDAESVIGHDEDRRPVANAGFIQGGQHASHAAVRIGYGRVARLRLRAFGVMRGVDVEQVQQQ